MRKLNVLSLLLISVITSIQVKAQAMDSGYVTVKEFGALFPVNPTAQATYYQYDALNRVNLVLGNTSDSVLMATLIDYDANGNITKNVTIQFIKRFTKKNNDRYFWKGYGDYFKSEGISEIIKKILKKP